jgi:eukaryotic-like serine/threonine-protein kinase
LAERRNLKDVATGHLARAALMELAYGNAERARAQASHLLSRNPPYDSLLAAALTLAMTGSVREAEAILSRLQRTHPQHTIINSVLIPIVRTAAALSLKQPERAVEQLRVVVPYESGIAAALVPIYLRGQAYLMQRSGSKGADEFQRVLDHRGTDLFSPFHAMAQLGLARAFAMAGNTAASIQAYERFLEAWSTADADIPALLAAREEYRRIKTN